MIVLLVFQYYIRTPKHQVALIIRALSTITMALLPLVANLLLYWWKTDILRDEGLSEIVETVTQVGLTFELYSSKSWSRNLSRF